MKRIISLLIVLSLLCVTTGCSDRNSKVSSNNNENENIGDTIPGTDTYDNNVDFFFTPTLEPDQNVTLSPESATTGIPASEPTPAKIPKPEDLPIEEVFTYYPVLFPIIDSSTARKSICAAIEIDGAESTLNGTELEEPLIKTAAVAYADYGRILSDCLNMGKMAISSVQHLPIFKFDTYSELESFREKFKDDLCLDEGRDEVASFNESTGDG